MSFHPTQKLFENDPYKLKDIAGLPLLSTSQLTIDPKPFYEIARRILFVNNLRNCGNSHGCTDNNQY